MGVCKLFSVMLESARGIIKLTSIVVNRIPVYVLNALYLAPITLWTYLKHGRPAKVQNDYEHINDEVEDHGYHDHEDHGTDVERGQQGRIPSEEVEEHQDISGHGPMYRGAGDNQMSGHSHMQHEASGRPMFATITIAVCHCGAGCLLGDIFGEWFVYGTGLQINGSEIWVEFSAGWSICLSSCPVCPCLSPYELRWRIDVAQLWFMVQITSSLFLLASSSSISPSLQ